MIKKKKKGIFYILNWIPSILKLKDYVKNDSKKKLYE